MRRIQKEELADSAGVPSAPLKPERRKNGKETFYI